MLSNSLTTYFRTDPRTLSSLYLVLLQKAQRGDTWNVGNAYCDKCNCSATETCSQQACTCATQSSVKDGQT